MGSCDTFPPCAESCPPQLLKSEKCKREAESENNFLCRAFATCVTGRLRGARYEKVLHDCKQSRDSSVHKLHYAYKAPLLYEYQTLFHTVHSTKWACTNLSYSLVCKCDSHAGREYGKLFICTGVCDERKNPTTNTVKRRFSKEMQDCVQGVKWWFVVRNIVFEQPNK